ncbi:hypothetical protein BH18THE2_BH18THE2_40020 [soil metagenome]
MNAEQTGKNVLCSDSKSDINVIVGTTKVTEGTDENDVIIGCSHLLPDCSSGDTILAKDGSDVIQGSSADDNLYGDEGKDEVTGADGNDELYGGPNNDVLQAGFGGDFLVGGPGNDELYAGAGDDVLIGGRGADYFDCGDGQDTIVDFNPAKGDTQAGNCEVSLGHKANNIGLKSVASEGESRESQTYPQFADSSNSEQEATKIVESTPTSATIVKKTASISEHIEDVTNSNAISDEYNHNMEDKLMISIPNIELGVD